MTDAAYWIFFRSYAGRGRSARMGGLSLQPLVASGGRAQNEGQEGTGRRRNGPAVTRHGAPITGVDLPCAEERREAEWRVRRQTSKTERRTSPIMANNRVSRWLVLVNFVFSAPYQTPVAPQRPDRAPAG